MGDAPPVIPDELRPYNSYIEDPKWQTNFTIGWTAALGLFVLFALPRLTRRIKNGSILKEMIGLRGDGGRAYERLAGDENLDKPERRKAADKKDRGSVGLITKVLNGFGSIAYWSPPWLELNAGQVFIICAYLVLTITCSVYQAPLITDPNRPGFLAISQLPPVFLFATKNSILSLLLGPGAGYEKLNFLHRWAGRGLFLGALIHGALWIRDHLQWGIPILGPQKETSGVACFALLCIIVLTSLRPVRRSLWGLFWIMHLLCYVAFFVAVCYHTIYAIPWVYAPLAFYGLDLLLRMVKMRIQDAVLVPADKQMTLIHVPYTSSGWTAGQHVRLRVFFEGRIFESHPLTIMGAPPGEGCLARPVHFAPLSTEEASSCHKKRESSASNGSTTEGGAHDAQPAKDGKQSKQSSEAYYVGSGGLLLGARAVGDWTRALNAYAHKEGRRLKLMEGLDDGEGEKAEATTPHPVPVHVMIDGPYGGCSIDPAEYETVLLVSGGSGATFAIGMLDALVGKCVRAKSQVRTRKIEFVWYMKSFGAVNWFSTLLRTISLHASTSCPELDLHITVYVTCLCSLENVPQIPNCDVLLARPGVGEVVKRIVEGTTDPAAAVEEGDVVVDNNNGVDPKKGQTGKPSSSSSSSGALPIGDGGLAVCASGPERLTREAANAVARLSASRRGREVGRIGLHTESYAV